MISSVTGVNYIISALNRVGKDRAGESFPPSTLSRVTEDTVSIRKLEPSNVARLYLSNGLLAGDKAPGGAGRARQIGSNGQTLASSGGPMFVSRELPTVQTAPQRLMDKVQEDLASKQSEEEAVQKDDQDQPSFLERISNRNKPSEAGSTKEWNPSGDLLDKLGADRKNPWQIQTDKPDQYTQKLPEPSFGRYQGRRAAQVYRNQESQYGTLEKQNDLGLNLDSPLQTSFSADI